MGKQKRMSRKELHQPDRIEQLLFNFVDYAYKNRQKFIAGAIIAAVLILGAWGGNQYYQAQQIEQSNLFYAVQKVLNDNQLSQSDRYHRGVQVLDKFIAEDPNDFLKAVALLQLGKLHAQQQQWSLAEKAYQQVLTFASSPLMLNTAKLSIASIYENQLRWNEAVQMIKKITDSSWEDVRYRALARIALAQGNQTLAKSHLQQLLKTVPDSTFKQEAETLLMTIN